MDTLELDADAFYICTEVSPRNYVVQKAIQIDKSQIERMVGGDLEKNAAAAAGSNSSNSATATAGGAASQPPPPPLPFWFTRECKERLMQVEVPPMGSNPPPPPQIQYYMHNAPQQPPIDLKQQLKNQLEYYFSRDNLMSDKYLRCQMDNEQYVPITVIAGFRKITQLTSDYNLILQALRESNLVEVDERGEKVRPITKRTTIILREIGKEYKDDVEKMLSGGPPYLDLKYGLNDSWYVTYATEEMTQDAFIHLKGSDVMFNSRPICARIKAGGPPSNIDQQPPPQQPIPPTQMIEPAANVTLDHQQQMFPTMMDLGHVLSAYGFVPVATYRPSTATNATTNNTPMTEEEAKTPIATRHAPFKYSSRGGGGGAPRGKKPSAMSNGVYRHQTPDEAPNSSSRGGGGATTRPINNYTWRRANEPRYRRGGGGGTNDTNQRRPTTTTTTTPAPNSKTSYPPLAGAAASGREDGPVATSSWLHVANNVVDLPPPPVWPAPNHARRNKRDSSGHGEQQREETQTTQTRDGNVTPTPTDTATTAASSESGTMENYQAMFDRKQSGQSSTSTSYSYEEHAFPSLPKTQSPTEKRAEKPTFSSVAAGRRHLANKPVAPETKKSYAEKLKAKGAS